MNKTIPVRWWRDDATRYDARPLIGICRTTPEMPQWAFDLIARPINPELQLLSEWLAEERRWFWTAMALPMELLSGSPSGTSGTGLAVAEYRDHIAMARR